MDGDKPTKPTRPNNYTDKRKVYAAKLSETGYWGEYYRKHKAMLDERRKVYYLRHRDKYLAKAAEYRLKKRQGLIIPVPRGAHHSTPHTPTATLSEHQSLSNSRQGRWEAKQP